MVNLPSPGPIRSLRYKKLSPHARPPVRSSPQAAGLDLSSAKNLVLEPKGKAIVPTDLCISVPPGTYGRIAPRSGLASKHFIDVGAGVIDEDYRGNVGVLLFNFGDKAFEIKEGDRIAQLICERIAYAEPEEVQEVPDTDRGEGGFGSTGV